MVLRFLAAVQDRYARFRCRRYIVRPPRIAYADDAVRAAMYRPRRKYVLAGVLAYMLARKARQR